MRAHTAIELWRLGGTAANRERTAGRVYSVRAHRRRVMLALVAGYGL